MSSSNTRSDTGFQHCLRGKLIERSAEGCLCSSVIKGQCEPSIKRNAAVLDIPSVSSLLMLLAVRPSLHPTLTSSTGG